MAIKLFIILVLAAILYCLGSGLYFLMKTPTQANSTQTVKALTWRIGLSIALFLLIVLAGYMGWITPNASPLQ